MLVDSGAEVSAISTSYEEEITKQIGQLSMLLSGLSVYNAIGNKNTKVDRQVLVPIDIKSITFQTPFIVVPNFNEGGIIGDDFLESNKANINYSKRSMSLKTATGPGKLKFIKKKAELQCT